MEDDKLEFEVDSSSSSSSELLITQTQKDTQDMPLIEGTSIYEFEIDKLEEKPWLRPGSDITDYFNYGFNENTWKVYCAKQREVRNDTTMYKKEKEADRRFVDQRRNVDMRQRERGEPRDYRREDDRYRKFDDRAKRNDFRRRYE